MNRKQRLSKIKYLFDVLLLFVNSVGIIGALTEILEVPYRGADRMTFWAVIFCFCTVSAYFWSTNDKKKLFRRFLACAGIFFFLVLVFRTELTGGVFLGLRGAVEALNERYQFHLTWPDGLEILKKAGWAKEAYTWIIMFAMLAFVFPFLMLGGLLLKKGSLMGLALGNALWFSAACTWDMFPDFFFLIFSILGAAAALVQREFGENHSAGLAAVAWVMTLSGFGLAAIYYLLMPALDEAYKEGYEDRRKLYNTVNEEWIPWFRSKVSGIGLGSGTDVAGTLNRQNLFAYTSGDIYRVTVNSIPEGTLYLKSFVGAAYGEKEWKAVSDREFEQYYKQKGFEPPEDYRKLTNLTYEALGALRKKGQEGRIQIEELADRGSYSVYPYGALLTKAYTAHSDGSVERKDDEYSFRYRYPEGYGGEDVLEGEWRRLEQQYRKYVYDSFLEYPEQLEQFTEALRRAKIRTDSVYHCVLDIMSFLDRHGDYNLDAGKNPSGTDFVEYFLFESHEGYCVHFASAGVLALRYFGIPARYVTGYVVPPSDFAATDGGNYAAVVKSRQAHAWAEIYLDGIGWVPVEMTPGGTAMGDNRIEQMTSLGRLSGETKVSPPSVKEEEPLPPEVSEVSEPSAPPQKETDAPEDKNMSSAKEAEEEQEPGVKEADGKEAEIPSSFDWRILAAAFQVTAFLILFSALILLGRYLHRRSISLWRGRLKEEEARRQVLLLYQNLRKVLKAAGCSRKMEADEEVFRNLLENRFPGLGWRTEAFGAEYDAFCQVLSMASFGGRELSEEEAEIVIRVHDKMVREAAEKMPRYKKPFLWLFRCYIYPLAA